ncbi:hypothetical protein B0H12DRAFT_1166442, partial [Mycena haematopus]
MGCWDERHRQQGLARLARTCRFFMNPALDQLWRPQSSVLPLLRCFPLHLWELRSGSLIAGPTFYLKTAVVTRDWERVLFYSPRIREFRNLEHGLTLDVLELLAASPADLFPGPNLQVLSWWP